MFKRSLVAAQGGGGSLEGNKDVCGLHFWLPLLFYPDDIIYNTGCGGPVKFIWKTKCYFAGQKPTFELYGGAIQSETPSTSSNFIVST